MIDTSQRSSVVVADDHPLVLEGLRQLFATASDFVLAASYTDGQTALGAIEQIPPDFAVLDLYMPGLSGLEVLQALATRPDIKTRVIFFGAALEDRDIHKAVSYGAWGILFKDSAPSELLSCLRTVQAGERWLPGPIQTAIERETERLRRGSELKSALTTRELEVVRLAARGLSNTEIAAELGLSLATVKVHMHRIYPKVGASCRPDVVAVGREHSDTLGPSILRY